MRYRIKPWTHLFSVRVWAKRRESRPPASPFFSLFLSVFRNSAAWTQCLFLFSSPRRRRSGHVHSSRPPPPFFPPFPPTQALWFIAFFPRDKRFLLPAPPRLFFSSGISRCLGSPGDHLRSHEGLPFPPSLLPPFLGVFSSNLYGTPPPIRGRPAPPPERDRVDQGSRFFL